MNPLSSHTLQELFSTSYILTSNLIDSFSVSSEKMNPMQLPIIDRNLENLITCEWCGIKYSYKKERCPGCSGYRSK